MPNWVKNRLTVYGSTEVLEKFERLVSSEKCCFDFMKIVTPPKELQQIEKCVENRVDSEISYIAYILKTENRLPDTLGKMHGVGYVLDNFFYNSESKEDYRKQLRAILKDPDEMKRRRINLEIGKVVKKMMDEYGVPDWYEWNCKFWGTKWNSSDAELEYGYRKLIYTFDTAWSDVMPLLKTLINNFRDELKMEYYWADEGIGDNVGHAAFTRYNQKARIIEDEVKDGSYEAFQIYSEVWEDPGVLDCIISESDGTYSLDREAYYGRI